MPNLLQTLTEDAVTLVEQELPAADQLRPLLGALVKHVDELENKLLGKEAAPVQQLQHDVASTVEQAVTDVGEKPAADSTSGVVDTAPGEQLATERKQALEELFTRIEKLL